jgi:F-type H+-transporting ATPase subunit b
VDFNLTLVGQTVAMIVFVWFCMKYVWPPLLEMIETRQKEIADGLAAAEKGRNSLDDAKVEVDRLVGEARDQARSIVDQANARANTIIEEARAEGVAARQREVEAGLAQIELDKSRARDELREQVAAIAVAGAEKVLGREIDASAHRDLLDQLANDLQAG